MTEQRDYAPLDTFIAHYTDLKADYWREVVIESRPKALSRVLALAKEFGHGLPWSQCITDYLESYRLALAAARNVPALGARTTLWTVSGPAFVRRMSGSYRLHPARGTADDWSCVQWVRLSEETALDVALQARQQGTTCARVLSRIIEAHYQHGGVNADQQPLADLL